MPTCSGSPIVLEQGEREARFPSSGGQGAPTASVPLHTGERPIGALGFRFAPGYTFSAEDRALVSSLGDHCAQALERARLYDAEHRAREALDLLATVGVRLAGTLDADDALRTLASLVVPAIADQCVVDLVEHGHIRRLVAVHADPALQEAARVLETFAPDLNSDTPVAVAIRTATTQLVPLTGELPESAYRSPEHRDAVVAIGLRSMLSAPLVVRGRTIGALTFGWRQDRAYGGMDIGLAEELARRAALAIENARLYRRSTTSRTPCSRASCLARSRSRPASRSSRATGPAARAPRSAATSTTPGRPARTTSSRSATWPGTVPRRPRSRA